MTSHDVASNECQALNQGKRSEGDVGAGRGGGGRSGFGGAGRSVEQVGQQLQASELRARELCKQFVEH